MNRTESKYEKFGKQRYVRGKAGRIGKAIPTHPRHVPKPRSRKRARTDSAPRVK